MNYYKKHLGDYAKKTGHLSPLEHGVYGLIMDAYYDREQGPTLVEAMRWARARSEDEKAAVSAVLEEFFDLGEDCRYTQKRIEDELATYRAQAEVNRSIAVAREQRKRERRQHEDSTNRAPIVHDNEQDREPSHKPIAISHKPISKNIVADAPAGDAVHDVVEQKKKAEPKFDAKAALIADGVDAQQAADFLQIRKAKKAPLTLTALDGIKAEAAKAGMTLASAVAVCCMRGWQGFKAAWVLGDTGSVQRSNNGRPSINSSFKPGADDEIFNQMRRDL